MNTRIFVSLIMALLLSFSFMGCKKYDEGPLISFIPKDERVANTWIVEKAFDDGNDVTGNFDEYTLTLTEDNDAQLVANYTILGVEFEFDTEGTWSFEDKKERIKMDFENDAADATYEILKLKEKELWLREVGDDLELRLEPK